MARHLEPICEPATEPGPTGQDSAFKHVLAGFDADLGIIDLNHIDKRLQIGLPERH